MAAARTVRLLVAVLLVSLLLRLVFAALTDLSLDEAYAYAVSGTFQWSFFDHPPLMFWISFAMQALFGRDLPPLVLRLPFILMFTASTVVLYQLTSRFYGVRAGLWAAAFINVMPFFLVSVGCWVVPDGPLVLALLCATLFFARALDGNVAAWRDWILTGLCLGLALLSKYHALVVGLGYLVILASPAHRHWLRRPQPYAAAVLAILLFSPVVWWNAANGWASFAFQLARGVGAGGLQLRQLGAFVLGEAIYLSPLLFVGLLVALFRARDAGTRFLLPLALPLILLLNILQLGGRQGLPHWPMPGWLFLLPLLGALASKARLWPVVTLVLSALIALIIPVYTIMAFSNWRVLPNNPAMLREFTSGADWSGVAAGLARTGLIGRPDTFFAAMNWQDAARLSSTLRPTSPPVVIGDDPRGFAFLSSPADHIGQDAILVTSTIEAAETAAFAREHFKSVENIGTFETDRGGKPAFSHVVLLGHAYSVAPEELGVSVSR